MTGKIPSSNFQILTPSRTRKDLKQIHLTSFSNRSGLFLHRRGGQVNKTKNRAHLTCTRTKDASMHGRFASNAVPLVPLIKEEEKSVASGRSYTPGVQEEEKKVAAKEREKEKTWLVFWKRMGN
ncbi:hypothetical protein Trydic_g23210 [Trypoxylus dichotomus]